MFEKPVQLFHGLEPGQPIPANQLTATERKQLEAMGMTTLEVVPENMAEILAEIQRDISNPVDLPVAPDTKPIDGAAVVRGATQFADLPADKQDEIRKFLTDAQNYYKTEERRAAARIDGAAPGINAAIDAALDAEEKISDTRVSEPKMTEPTDVTGAVSKHCPNCGWNQAEALLAEPTEEEKTAFVVASIAGNRVKRSYPLLNGAVTLTFRTLLEIENDAIKEYAAVKQSRDKLHAFAVSNIVSDVSALASLDSVKFAPTGAPGVPGRYDVLESLADILTDAKNNIDAIDKYCEKIKYQILKTDVMVRQVQKYFIRFFWTMNTLEARMYDTNFYRPRNTEAS